uniref:Radical SAM protein n=1 Tax=Fervidobacterium pennivorans TaxID=93466 RepID=A0A7V4NDU9_FERPE
MGTERILVSLIHYPLYVLGPGRRVGLWTQGCTIHCKGCMSIHTWEFDESKAVDIDELAQMLSDFNCNKLTISGGEPFDQASSLLSLLRKVRGKFSDILVYTGYKFETLLEKYPEHFEYIDAIVDSPFIEGMESEYVYKGSDNQRLFVLNKDLQEEYDEWMNRQKDGYLQIKVKDNALFIIGIPYQKDLERIRKSVEQQFSKLASEQIKGFEPSRGEEDE